MYSGVLLSLLQDERDRSNRRTEQKKVKERSHRRDKEKDRDRDRRDRDESRNERKKFGSHRDRDTSTERHRSDRHSKSRLVILKYILETYPTVSHLLRFAANAIATDLVIVTVGAATVAARDIIANAIEIHAVDPIPGSVLLSTRHRVGSAQEHRALNRETVRGSVPTVQTRLRAPITTAAAVKIDQAHQLPMRHRRLLHPRSPVSIQIITITSSSSRSRYII